MKFIFLYECYCKRCKSAFSGHTLERRGTHPCNKGIFDGSTKKDYEMAAMFTCSYEDQPTAIEAVGKSMTKIDSTMLQ
jgi:hypothetical protein